MKLANRIGAAVLATAMVGTLLTGCGGGSASTIASTGDGTAAASSTESSGDGDNTYTMFMRSAYVDWIKELKWYDVAEERTGIHVDYISGPEEAADVYSEVDQRVISGDLPDAVMTKLAQTNVYGPQGVFADLAPYIEKYGGKTWPWRRIVEHGEGFIGPWNDVNNRRYEYPVMMQSKDGKIHAAYAWGRRVRIKYVCVDEAWIRGAKVCKGAEDNPEMPCNR